MEPIPGIPKELDNLAQQLKKLPGIGARSALNIATHLARDETDTALQFADALINARATAQICQTCYGLSDEETCAICADSTRAANRICVLQATQEIPVMEKLGTYQGKYHVLHGLLDPLRGITPRKLTIPELLNRLEAMAADPTAELILAVSHTMEGDMTADYIAKQCRQREYGFAVTRTRRGLSRNQRLEYADLLTLTAAIENRRTLDEEPLPEPEAAEPKKARRQKGADSVTDGAVATP